MKRYIHLVARFTLLKKKKKIVEFEIHQSHLTNSVKYSQGWPFSFRRQIRNRLYSGKGRWQISHPTHSKMEHLKNRRISNPYENSDRIFFHPLFNLRFYIEKKKFLNIKINKIHSPLNIYTTFITWPERFYSKHWKLWSIIPKRRYKISTLTPFSITRFGTNRGPLPEFSATDDRITQILHGRLVFPLSFYFLPRRASSSSP